MSAMTYLIVHTLGRGEYAYWLCEFATVQEARAALRDFNTFLRETHRERRGWPEEYEFPDGTVVALDDVDWVGVYAPRGALVTLPEGWPT